MERIKFEQAGEAGFRSEEGVEGKSKLDLDNAGEAEKAEGEIARADEKELEVGKKEGEEKRGGEREEEPQTEREGIEEVESKEREDAPKRMREQTLREQLKEFYRAVQDFYAIVAQEEEITPILEQAKDWLPRFIGYLKQHEEALIRKLYANRYHAVLRPEKAKLELKTFLGDIRFGMEGPSDPEKRGELRMDFLNYGLEKIKEVAAILDLDLERFEESREDDNVPLETPALESENGTQDSPVAGNILKTSKKLAALASSLGSGAVQMAVSLLDKSGIGKLPMMLFPHIMEKKIWKSLMLARVFKQMPGAGGGFFEKWAPKVIIHTKVSALSSLHLRYYTTLQTFNRYDPADDSFESRPSESEEGGREVREYETPLGDIKKRKIGARLKELVDLHELELLHIDPHELKNKESGLVRLPKVWDLDDAEVIPLYVTARVRNQEESLGDVECPIFYDEERNLYFNPSAIPENVQDVAVKMTYTTWSLKKGGNIPLHLSYFVGKNRKFFDRSRHLELDGGAIENELKFTDRIKKEFDGWRRLPSDKEKLEAIRSFFKKEFAYSSGPFTGFRIRLQPGNNDLEKIMSAEEGNCYDTNRLAYVILQRLGIPCELHKGFAEGRQEDVEQFYGYAIPELDTLPMGARVGVEGDYPLFWRRGRGESSVTTAHGHAFLRCFDRDVGAWSLLDATPRYSKKRLVRERKQERRWEQVRQEAEGKRGLPSFEAIRAREKFLLRKYFDALGYWGGGGLSGNRYIKNPDTGFVEFVRSEIPTLFFAHSDSSYSGSAVPRLFRDPDAKSYVDGVQKFEKLSILTLRAYELCDSYTREMMAPVGRELERFMGKIMTAKKRENLREELGGFIFDHDEDGFDFGLLEGEKITKGLLRFFSRRLIQPPNLDRFHISYDVKGRRFKLNDKKIGSEEEILSLVEQELKRWQEDNKEVLERLASFVGALSGGETLSEISGRMIEEVLQAREKPISGAHRAFFDWIRGKSVGKVVADREGKKKLQLEDSDTGGRYIVRKGGKIHGLKEKEGGG